MLTFIEEIYCENIDTEPRIIIQQEVVKSI